MSLCHYLFPKWFYFIVYLFDIGHVSLFYGCFWRSFHSFVVSSIHPTEGVEWKLIFVLFLGVPFLVPQVATCSSHHFSSLHVVAPLTKWLFSAWILLDPKPAFGNWKHKISWGFTPPHLDIIFTTTWYQTWSNLFFQLLFAQPSGSQYCQTMTPEIR